MPLSPPRQSPQRSKTRRRILLLSFQGGINARNAGGINSEPDFNIVKNKPIFVKKPVR